MDITGLIFGHLFGDYLFQTRGMAWTKTAPGLKGFFACFRHCLLYATMVTICLLNLPYSREVSLKSILLLWLISFITHFPIDRWSLAKYWMKFLGRTPPALRMELTTENLFNVIVYVVIDNTMHLYLMYSLIELLIPEIH